MTSRTVFFLVSQLPSELGKGVNSNNYGCLIQQARGAKDSYRRKFNLPGYTSWIEDLSPLPKTLSLIRYGIYLSKNKLSICEKDFATRTLWWVMAGSKRERLKNNLNDKPFYYFERVWFWRSEMGTIKWYIARMRVNMYFTWVAFTKELKKYKNPPYPTFDCLNLSARLSLFHLAPSYIFFQKCCNT